MGRSIARVKRNNYHPVTKLFRTTAQGKQECTTQQDLSMACIIENKKRFSHTFDTPPMCTALIDSIGYDAEKEGGKQILDGTFVSPLGTPKYMHTVLDPLSMPQLVVHRGTIFTLISTHEYILGWEERKERTASY